MFWFGKKKTKIAKAKAELLLEKGNELYKQGEHEQAIAELKQALELYPQLPLAHSYIGACYLKLENYQEALVECEAELVYNKTATAYTKRAMVYYHLKKYNLALEDVNNAINLEPQNAESYSVRGWVYEALEQPEVALADYNRALGISPNDPEIYAGRACSYMALKNYNLALADYNMALKLEKLDGNKAHYYVARGMVYLWKDEQQAALTDFTQAIYLNPGDAAAYEHRSDVYKAMEEYERALQDITKAIELDENQIEYFLSRADIYRELEQFENALADYTVVLEEEPQNLLALTGRGVCLVELGQYAQALVDLKQALAQETNNIDIYICLVEAYEELKAYPEALAISEQALQCEPSVEIYNQRSQIYYLMEQYTEALAEINKALELDSANQISLHNRGVTCIKLGKYERAIADLSQSLKLGENPDWTTYKYRALAFEALYLPERALEDYNQALKLEPTEAVLYLNRAALYAKLGEKGEAISDCRRVLQTATDPTEITAARQLLKEL